MKTLPYVITQSHRTVFLRNWSNRLTSADLSYILTKSRSSDRTEWRLYREDFTFSMKKEDLCYWNATACTYYELLASRNLSEPIRENSDLMLLLRAWLGNNFKPKLLELKTPEAILGWLEHSPWEVWEMMGNGTLEPMPEKVKNEWLRIKPKTEATVKAANPDNGTSAFVDTIAVDTETMNALETVINANVTLTTPPLANP